MTDQLPDDSAESDTRRSLLKALAAAGVVGGGSLAASGSAAAQGGGSSLLKNIDVTGTLSDGGSFDGTMNITKLDVTNGGDSLTVGGVLKGTATTADGTTRRVTQQFSITGALQDILGVITPDSQQECPILTLDLGPINLDVLGLQVDLSRVELDITAVAGQGNLLGNLLCAVANLLNP